MDLVVERPPPPPVWTVLQSTVLRVPYTATHISYFNFNFILFLLSTFYVLISTFYFSTFRHLNINNFIVLTLYVNV